MPTTVLSCPSRFNSLESERWQQERCQWVQVVATAAVVKEWDYRIGMRFPASNIRSATTTAAIVNRGSVGGGSQQSDDIATSGMSQDKSVQLRRRRQALQRPCWNRVLEMHFAAKRVLAVKVSTASADDETDQTSSCFMESFSNFFDVKDLVTYLERRNKLAEFVVPENEGDLVVANHEQAMHIQFYQDIANRYPNLEHLALFFSNNFTTGVCYLALLGHFLQQDPLPKLIGLSIWIPDSGYCSSQCLADLCAVINGMYVPNLRQLHLKISNYSNRGKLTIDLFRVLPALRHFSLDFAVENVNEVLRSLGRRLIELRVNCFYLDVDEFASILRTCSWARSLERLFIGGFRGARQMEFISLLGLHMAKLRLLTISNDGTQCTINSSLLARLAPLTQLIELRLIDFHMGKVETELVAIQYTDIALPSVVQVSLCGHDLLDQFATTQCVDGKFDVPLFFHLLSTLFPSVGFLTIVCYLEKQQDVEQIEQDMKQNLGMLPKLWGHVFDMKAKEYKFLFE